MSTQASEVEATTGGGELHLPDLVIRGFRGIDDLTIPRLGRVTLLAGKNGVGKTTVLDAVRVFAAGGDTDFLRALLEDREERSLRPRADGGMYIETDWAALFNGRRIGDDACIVIGTEGDDIRIEAGLSAGRTDQSAEEPRRMQTWSYRGTQMQALDGRMNPPPDRSRRRFEERHRQDERPRLICESLGPDVLLNANLGELWRGVPLTDEEDRTVEALRLVLGEDIRRVALAVDEGDKPRMIVRLGSHDHPVPLASLGGGAARLFVLALTLAKSAGGFLLIDEAENGIHHSVQRDYWRMVLAAADANDVQVLATTHSWDCVRGFAQAAAENEDAEGLLYRIERLPAGLRAVKYSKDGLRVAAEQGIEVR